MDNIISGIGISGTERLQYKKFSDSIENYKYVLFVGILVCFLAGWFEHSTDVLILIQKYYFLLFVNIPLPP